MAVASTDYAPPDAENRNDPPIGGCVFQEVSQWPGDQRAERRCPLAVSEFGALRGAIRRESSHLRQAHRSLRWPSGDVPLPVSPYCTDGARNRQCRDVYWPDGAAYATERVQAYPVLRGAGDQDICQGEGRDSSRPG